LARPALILGLTSAALIAIWAISGETNGARMNALVDRYGFDPLRYFANAEDANRFGTGVGPINQAPTLVTYAFLHVNAAHVFSNILTLVAFGLPVGLRLKDAWRLLVLLMAGAAGGALLFGAFHLKDGAVLVGASGAVSALVGAFIRFGFQREAFADPPAAIAPLFGKTNALFSVTIIILMIIFARFDPHLSGPYARIAFEAHIGGFITGAFAMSVLDRRRR
jgi:membrane associated rhomboid family serine protease